MPFSLSINASLGLPCRTGRPLWCANQTPCFTCPRTGVCKTTYKWCRVSSPNHGWPVIYKDRQSQLLVWQDSPSNSRWCKYGFFQLLTMALPVDGSNLSSTRRLQLHLAHPESFSSTRWVVPQRAYPPWDSRILCSTHILHMPSVCHLFHVRYP